MTKPDLLIRFKRAPDGSAAVTCVRADGSTTWQRQRAGLGAALPAHDLTHFAVESVLRYQHAFYGLIADGWDITDFAAPYARGPVPRLAREAELVVGVFDMQRMMGHDWSPVQLREQGTLYAASIRTPRDELMLPELTDADIARVYAARADVFARWSATAAGETLELSFTR